MQKEEVHFCRFFPRKSRRSGFYQAGTNVGYDTPRLAFITKGSCRVEGSFGTLFIKPGDLWFLPKDTPYVSHWSTEDEIAFELIEFDADFISLHYKTMQVLPFPDFDQLYAPLWERWKKNDSYGALAAFYAILAAVLPKLHRSENLYANRILPALKYIQEYPEAKIKVDELASMCFLSTSRFFEVFRDAMGESPINFKNKVRASRARHLLLDGKSVEEVCALLGFSSPSFLRRILKKHLGLTPNELKKERSI